MIVGNVEQGRMRLSGIVGESFTADEVFDSLERFGGRDIRVNLQSEGGIITEGLAIYEHFADYSGKITVRIEALAASIASVFMLAADTIEAGEVATVMVHDPWSFAIGNAAEMRETADVLDHLGLQIAQAYADRSGETPEHWLEIMANETYFTAAQAKSAGIVDEVLARSNRKRAQAKPKPVAKLSRPVARATVADAMALAKRLKTRIVDNGGRVSTK